MTVSPRTARHELLRRAFSVFPQVGVAFDGSPIRAVGRPGDADHCAQEPGGYMCSPIAYSVRAQFKDTGWCDTGERGMSADDLLTVVIAAECRP
jgi:hypothetical protein